MFFGMNVWDQAGGLVKLAKAFLLPAPAPSKKDWCGKRLRETFERERERRELGRIDWKVWETFWERGRKGERWERPARRVDWKIERISRERERGRKERDGKLA
jgi:hypothetical protein